MADINYPQALEDYIEHYRIAIEQGIPFDEDKERNPIEGLLTYSTNGPLANEATVREVQAYLSSTMTKLRLSKLRLRSILLFSDPARHDDFFVKRVEEIQNSPTSSTGLEDFLKYIAVARSLRDKNPAAFSLLQSFAAYAIVFPLLAYNVSLFAYQRGTLFNTRPTTQRFYPTNSKEREHAIATSEELFHFLDDKYAIDPPGNNLHDMHSPVFGLIHALDALYGDNEAASQVEQLLRDASYDLSRSEEKFAKYCAARSSNWANVISQNEGLMSTYFDHVVQLDIALMQSNNLFLVIKSRRMELYKALEELERSFLTLVGTDDPSLSGVEKAARLQQSKTQIIETAAKIRNRVFPGKSAGDIIALNSRVSQQTI